MVDYRVAEGIACYDCQCARCECESIEADWLAAEAAHGRQVHRSARLIAAIDATERRIDSLPEFDVRIHDLFEKHANLTKALLNHRRALKGY